MNMRLIKYWIISNVALILVVITFTPLVIPYGIYKPEFLGLPYSLWMSILISLGLVVLTFIASRLYPESDSEDKK